ncbi:unnamed protein product [Didymodactylos carnosus]|uniref:Uncharacterized protein n=1 Tax=Didymodactylos carnosus TaxID=1234261 RepID=A0A8S2SDX7_9BILA|nr:unnamed protein product [Didymodactylos carnosus]CAF4224128.1 unnamed protein product [Didymodactylos carnosus]
MFSFPGKTSIFQRFANDSFSTDYASTIGVDFQIRTIDIDSKYVKLQIWDTAGQDRFKCVVRNFYRGAHGVLLCYDITDSESFRNIEEWANEIQRYCPQSIPIYLIGTKSDLKTERAVSYEQANECAEKRGIQYIETSSKTNYNVQKTFVNFAKTLIQHSDKGLTIDDSKDTFKSNVKNVRKVNAVKSSSCTNEKSCSLL